MLLGFSNGINRRRLLVSAAASRSFQQEQLADNPYYLFPLDDAAGGGVARNLGSQTIVATYQGAPIYQVASLTGGGNNAVHLNDGLVLGDLPGPDANTGEIATANTTGFCYEVLCQFQSFTPYTRNSVFANGNAGDGPGGVGMELDFNTGTWNFGLSFNDDANGGTQYFIPGPIPDINVTYHFVVELDPVAKVVNLYQDGALVGTQTYVGNYHLSWRHLSLGWNAGVFAYAADAVFQNWAIYPAPIGAARVAAHFRAIS